MTPRPRAISSEDKAQKRNEILDAAETLWLEDQHEIANMHSVATAAGVAKGTLYLYFPSKEELFLSLHERQVRTFFEMIIERAHQAKPMNIHEMHTVVRRFIESTPAFLPLTTLVHGLLERQIPAETSFVFKERILNHLNQAVDALKPHFPNITAHMMMQSYAMIIGLWQLLRPTPLRELIKERLEDVACSDDYLNALESALNALWRGNLMQEPVS
ncbi:MAG: TetR/AcrR family transcriptional regulator [Chromatiales bacterium]|nr:TetR/AcrR family transcriptional regulator [Chromatiales bacterium]